jgi:hypothetical protein
VVEFGLSIFFPFFLLSSSVPLQQSIPSLYGLVYYSGWGVKLGPQGKGILPSSVDDFIATCKCNTTFYVAR